MQNHIMHINGLTSNLSGSALKSVANAYVSTTDVTRSTMASSDSTNTAQETVTISAEGKQALALDVGTSLGAQAGKSQATGENETDASSIIDKQIEQLEEQIEALEEELSKLESDNSERAEQEKKLLQQQMTQLNNQLLVLQDQASET